MIKICGKEIPESACTESLSFIIDHPKLKDEKAYAYNKEFLKKLGLKGDSVGWCKFKKPTAEEMEKVFCLAKKENVSVRCIYELSLSSDYPSEWYTAEKCPIIPTDASEPHIIENGSSSPRKGFLEPRKDYLTKYKSYLLPVGAHIFDEGDLLFSEKAKAALEERGYSGGELLWAPDCGKYESRQYYTLYCNSHGEKAYKSFKWFCNHGSKNENLSSLPSVVQLMGKECRELSLDLPTVVVSKSMPKTDFCEVMIENGGLYITLISKNMRNFLIEKGLAKADIFIPVICCEDISPKETLPLIPIAWREHERNIEAIKEETEKLYKQHLKKKKPKRIVTEKLALQKLRQAKKIGGEYFGKKANEKALSDIPDKRLAPYYKVADGGTISDEYSFFSIAEATKERIYFHTEQAKEISDLSTEGFIPIGIAADGEYILLSPSGKVLRYQIGETAFSMEWNSLEAFFFEETE